MLENPIEIDMNDLEPIIPISGTSFIEDMLYVSRKVQDSGDPTAWRNIACHPSLTFKKVWWQCLMWIFFPPDDGVLVDLQLKDRTTLGKQTNFLSKYLSACQPCNDPRVVSPNLSQCPFFYPVNKDPISASRSNFTWFDGKHDENYMGNIWWLFGT